MENRESMIDLSLYEIFYFVCQNRSFSKTAQMLGVTQPSVSYNIKKLEDELGVLLFERGNVLSLTPEAEKLLPYVEESINSIRNGEEKINDIIHLKKGKVTIGIPSHIGSFLLVDIIKEFNLLYSEIKIEVVCKSTKELFKLLSINKIDLLIDSSPLDENLENLEIKKIGNEKCFFACNYGRKELLDKTIRLDELVRNPLIVPLRSSSSSKKLLELFERKNIIFNPKFEIATSDMIAEMINQDIGIGFLFEKTIEKYTNLKKITLNEELPNFDIFLLYKSSLLSITALEFIRFIIKELI